MESANTQYLRPSKDESFMEIAQSVSMRSTCLRRRYGAVIVSKDGRIVSTGYNGAPRNRANCIDLNVCLRDQKGIKPGTHYELCRAVHAEANAIINGNPLDIMGGTLYLCGTDAATNQPSAYISPCAMCQRMILNAQIERVVMRNVDGTLVDVNPLTWDDDAEMFLEQKRNAEAAEQSNATESSEQLGLDSCGDFGKGSCCSSEPAEQDQNTNTSPKASHSGCGCGGGCCCS